MPFTSPAQSELDQVNEQMEGWAFWDNLLKLAHQLTFVAREQRQLCKIELRKLERQIASILAQPKQLAT